MLRRLFTIGLFLTGGTSIALAARQSSLPHECRDLSLVKGNPATSKTIIFGDIHNKPECHSSYIKCAKALTANLQPKDIVLLVERAPIGKHVSCEEDSRADWGSLVGSCQGLNEPDELTVAKREIALKPKVNLELWNIISEASHLQETSRSQTITLQKFINEKIAHYKKLISASEKSHNQLFKKFAKNHATVKKEDFHSDELVNRQENELILTKLEGIQKDLTSKKSFKKILENLEKEEDAEFRRALSLQDDPSTFLKNPNVYFANSIHEQSKQMKKVFGIIGDKHVNKKSGNAQEKAIVDDLYQGLKQYEHENPWSVLSCN